MTETKRYEVLDRIRFKLFKDYNGRAYPVQEFDTLSAATEAANKIVDRENLGLGLTVRIYQQVGYVRKPKVKEQADGRDLA